MQPRPFFLRFLEDAPTPTLTTPLRAGAMGSKGPKGGFSTKKYPSDTDEPLQTMKYPSDSDEALVTSP